MAFGQRSKPQPACSCESQENPDPNCPLGKEIGNHEIPVVIKSDKPTGPRGRAVTKALRARTMDWLNEEVRIELPERPVDQWGNPLNPRLPWDITKIELDELGMLYGQFTAMYNYGAAQLGLVDVDHTESDYDSGIEEAKATLRSEGSNATERKAQARMDPGYDKAEQVRRDRKARKALLTKVVDGYERAFKCLSRELTRRGIAEER